MATSILHRATGVALYVGAFFFCFWIGSIAAGEQAYALAEGFFLSWLGRLMLFGWTLAITFHFANGVRHLFWDSGRGFSPGAANLTAWLAFLFAFGATALIWSCAYWLPRIAS